MRKLILLAALTASMVIPVTPASATFPGQPGFVAFTQAASDGHLVIAVAAPNLLTNTFASPQVLIDFGAGRDAQDAAWAADGTTLAFSAPLVPGGPAQIWVADGHSSPYPVTKGTHPSFDPAWSPDGGSIAFARLGTAGRPHVVVRNFATHTNVSVAPDLIESTQPAWSSTGQLVLSGKFVIGKPGVCSDLCRWQLYTADPAGIAPPTSLGSLTANIRQPDWSPDGSEIVATVSTRHQGYGLLVLDLAGNQVAFYQSGGSDTAYTDASWSPVGSHSSLLAFTLVEGSSRFVAMLDSGSLRFATSTEAWGPAWQPVPPA